MKRFVRDSAVSCATALLLSALASVSGAIESTHHAPAPVASVLVAAQVNDSNFALLVRGSSAIGGLGDYVLSNGTLCATISDPSHETYLSYRGGTLVDLGYCGRNDDQWNTYHELFNLSREKILPSETIATQITDHDAVIIVTGKVSGVENKTIYRLDLAHPEELAIETTLTRVEKSGALDLFGALILHPHRSLAPFVIDTHAPQYSKGFHHPHADAAGIEQLGGDHDRRHRRQQRQRRRHE